MVSKRRIAVIGAGPAGAIAVDCLAQERAFPVIRVFERRERAGGCWVQDPADRVPEIRDIPSLASGITADPPHKIPDNLPTYAPPSSQYRHAETSVYPHLETNIDSRVMEFSEEVIPTRRTELSISKHGPDTPFRHHTVIQNYIEGLLERNGYRDLVEYNTTVERVTKIPKTGGWQVTLRKEGPSKTLDYWWTEDFDAVVVASGHYSVPFVPHIQGLAEYAATYPGSVEHSKAFRDPEKYTGKRVVVVGASVSAMDIAVNLIGIAQSPVHCVVRGRWNAYFGGTAFDHPGIEKHPAIKSINSQNNERTVVFEDGSSIQGVDHIILGTGYSWTLPFLPDVAIRNNRIPDLYLHVFKQNDPTLIFIGAVAAGLTFKVYEWQAVLAARFLAGRIALPSLEEQRKWEADRIAYKGDGVPFTALYPDFEHYFETVRKLAGEPAPDQPGRRLPKFDKSWVDKFQAGHKLRIKMWKTANDSQTREGKPSLPKARL